MSALLPVPLQIDADVEAVADVRLTDRAVDQRRRLVELAQVRVPQQGAPIAVLAARTAQEAHLVELGARRHLDAERAGEDLGVELAFVFGFDPVERLGAVGDQPGEDVDAPRRALGVGERRDAGRQAQRLLQLDHVDAALFEHGAAVEAELVLLELVELLQHGLRLAGQEARPHPVGLAPQAQVDAGGLHLLRSDARLGIDLLAADQGLDLLGGQQPGLARHLDARQIVAVRRAIRVLRPEQRHHVLAHGLLA